MSNDLTIATISAAAVIIAALIGFIVALTTAVIAKEQKVSEFRQAWINDLRIDLADIYTLSFSCIFNIKEIHHIETNSEKYKVTPKEHEVKDLLNKRVDLNNETYNQLERRIILAKLKLNPEKDSAIVERLNSIHQKLDAFGYETEEEISKEILNENASALKIEIYEIEKLTHKILKNEWERVKTGELRYRFFISAGKILIWAFLAAFLVLVLIGSFPHLCKL